MAVTDAQVRDWLDKNPNASDAEIASVAKQAGVDSTQLSRVTNISKDVIENRASTVGVDLSPQTIQNTEQQVTESVNQAAETVSDTEATNAFNKVVDRAKTGDMNAFGQLLYFARQSNNPLPKQFIEQIGYAAKDNKTDAYNYAVGAQAVAEGYEARDEALKEAENQRNTMLEEHAKQMDEIRRALLVKEEDLKRQTAMLALEKKRTLVLPFARRWANQQRIRTMQKKVDKEKIDAGFRVIKGKKKVSTFLTLILQDLILVIPAFHFAFQLTTDLDIGMDSFESVYISLLPMAFIIIALISFNDYLKTSLIRP